jgi:hypothetical protein
VLLRLKPIGLNQTELYIGTYIILFSYETPVAAVSVDAGTIYRTKTSYSRTTSKHVSQWIKEFRYRNIQNVDNNWFDTILTVEDWDADSAPDNVDEILEDQRKSIRVEIFDEKHDPCDSHWNADDS